MLTMCRRTERLYKHITRDVKGYLQFLPKRSILSLTKLYLPTYRIIPFVAADAVVEDDPIKDSVRYPILERPDKFPVYYPAAAADTKDDTFPIRREDTYQPTQYPIFVMGKVEPSYAPVSQKVEPTRERYPEHNDLGVQEYTVSASLGSPMSGVQAVTKVPTTSTTFEVETPTVNRFSPPVETQGNPLKAIISNDCGHFSTSLARIGYRGPFVIRNANQFNQ